MLMSPELEGTIHAPSIYAWLANPGCDRGEGCVYLHPVQKQQITNRLGTCMYLLLYILYISRAEATAACTPHTIITAQASRRDVRFSADRIRQGGNALVGTL